MRTSISGVTLRAYAAATTGTTGRDGEETEMEAEVDVVTVVTRRDSASAADDLEAPHEDELTLPVSSSLSDLMTQLARCSNVPPVQGGSVWSVTLHRLDNWPYEAFRVGAFTRTRPIQAGDAGRAGIVARWCLGIPDWPVRRFVEQDAAGRSVVRVFLGYELVRLARGTRVPSLEEAFTRLFSRPATESIMGEVRRAGPPSAPE